MKPVRQLQTSIRTIRKTGAQTTRKGALSAQMLRHLSMTKLFFTTTETKDTKGVTKEKLTYVVQKFYWDYITPLKMGIEIGGDPLEIGSELMRTVTDRQGADAMSPFIGQRFPV